MANPIGVGVIGMGWMGEVHSRSYNNVPQRFPNSEIATRMVICADDSDARAGKAQISYGFEQCTTDWQAVVDHPDVDVVSVTTPNYLHGEMVAAVAAAGKHVYCEKPVGRGPQETAAAAAAAEKAGILSFVGYNYRWAPVVQQARQLISDGKLGDLTHYRGRFLTGYANSPHGVLSWRFQDDMAGLGTLGDLLSHVIDMSHMIAGPIKRVVGNRHTYIPQRPLATTGEGTHFSVQADGPMGDVTNEDYVGLLVQFENGAQGTFEACRIIKGKDCDMAFEVNGTEGALDWSFERMNELHLYLPGEGQEAGYTRVHSGPNHPNHMEFTPGPAMGLGYDDLKTIEAHEFLKSVVAGKQGQPGLAEAVAVAEVQAAVQRSWESGGWEDVKPIG